MAFHYSPEHIKLDRLKDRLSNLDSHLFIHPQGCTGFTLSRLSTLALLEGIVGDDSRPNRAETFTDKISEVLGTTAAYSDFVTHLLIDIVQMEFGKLSYDEVIIPEAPRIDDGPVLKFFVHPPQDSFEL